MWNNLIGGIALGVAVQIAGLAYLLTSSDIWERIMYFVLFILIETSEYFGPIIGTSAASLVAFAAHFAFYMLVYVALKRFVLRLLSAGDRGSASGESKN